MTRHKSLIQINGISVADGPSCFITYEAGITPERLHKVLSEPRVVAKAAGQRIAWEDFRK
jgi:hypothetical protein